MVKKVKFLSIILAVVLALSACSSSNSSGSEGNGEGASTENSGDQKKVKIVYAGGKDVTSATAKTIKAFEESHPNITVEFREMPSDSGKQHDAYVTQLNAKSSKIDVFEMDVVWPAEFAQAGYTLPLDRFIKQDNINLDRYNQGALSAAKFNGKIWALPKFIDAGMMFYRTDFVKEVPQTWDQLIAKAKKLQGKKGMDYGYVMQAKQYEGLVTNAVEFIAAYGGQIIDENGNVVVNSPDTIQGLKKMVQVATSDFVPGNVTTFTEIESNIAFIEGESPFVRNWPYQWSTANNKEKSEIAGNVGVAPLPAGDAGHAAALGGWMAGINKYSEHKKAAWEFLKFMTGPKGQKIDAIYGGHAPTILSLYEDEEVIKANPYFKKGGFQKALESAVSRPVVPNYQEVSQIIQTNVSEAISGAATVKEAAKNMEKELKAAVGK
ncbi:ABC transporter substrate-binding protein [Tuberibacillus sp. Marseille-P3662]|uniref:ABC transporter substrate-binding protein n=1 Tax=Tuberibacillus sp. Marseille-P3662 TaxID=1965358 RepID=UPI000A1C8BF6|nr:ABC transporter substrate-binding protein [Tuberibacillus sp. Marseille-P3662]